VLAQVKLEGGKIAFRAERGCAVLAIELLLGRMEVANSSSYYIQY